jgi:hypothetical protein
VICGTNQNPSINFPHYASQILQRKPYKIINNSLIFNIFLCQLVVSIHVGIAHCFETSLFYLKKDIDLRGQGFDIF